MPCLIVNVFHWHELVSLVLIQLCRVCSYRYVLLFFNFYTTDSDLQHRICWIICRDHFQTVTYYPTRIRAWQRSSFQCIYVWLLKWLYIWDMAVIYYLSTWYIERMCDRCIWASSHVILVTLSVKKDHVHGMPPKPFISVFHWHQQASWVV